MGTSLNMTPAHCYIYMKFTKCANPLLLLSLIGDMPAAPIVVLGCCWLISDGKFAWACLFILSKSSRQLFQLDCLFVTHYYHWVVPLLSPPGLQAYPVWQ